MELGRHLRLGAELGISLTAVSALILAGCGGGGGGGATTPGGSVAAALVTPMKGQFCSTATVTVLDKNNLVIGTGSVNASGVVSVGSISSSAPAPYVVKVGAGASASCYYDEGAASNVTIPANTTALHAVVPSYAALTSASGLAVTPLTEMAYQYLNTAGTLAVVADVTAVNNAVASGFGLTDILQTPTLIGPATTPLSNSTSHANRYALAIAALTQTAAASATGGQTTLDALLAQMPTFIASGVPATTYANAYSDFTGGASSVLATPAAASATAPTGSLASLIGGSGAVSCNTSLFAGGVRNATAGELSSYARTYSGNTGTFDVNFNFVPNGPATLVLGTSGSLTYNSAAQTVSSICYESAVPQLVVHYGSGGHVDLKTDGSFTGMGPDGTTVIRSGSTPPGTAPAAPTGVTATAASSTQINLSWSAASGAQGYRIYRSTTAGQAVSAMTDILGGAVTVATSYSDSGLTAGTTYYYKIVAANSSGDSAASSEVNATTQAGSSNPILTGDIGSLTISGGAMNQNTTAVPATYTPTSAYFGPDVGTTASFLYWEGDYGGQTWKFGFGLTSYYVFRSQLSLGNWQMQLYDTAGSNYQQLANNGLTFDLAAGTVTVSNISLLAAGGGAINNMVINGTLKFPPLTGTQLQYSGAALPYVGSGFDAAGAPVVTTNGLGKTYEWAGQNAGMRLVFHDYSYGKFLKIHNWLGDICQAYAADLTSGSFSSNGTQLTLTNATCDMLGSTLTINGTLNLQ
jgi:hypothetical protein